MQLSVLIKMFTIILDQFYLGNEFWNSFKLTLALDRDPWKLYLMFLSREIDLQLCQIYTKINIYPILY